MWTTWRSGNTKMTKIICFGTFDILHLGHLNYFKQAKKLGDYLIVVIARDQNVKKKLIFNEKERLELVKSLEIVDQAVLGDLNDHFKIIKKIKPDLICLGYDHKIKRSELKSKLGMNFKIMRMKPYQIDKYKSSKIKSQ